MSTKSIIKVFLETVSLNGAKWLVVAVKRWLRILWLIAILLGVVILTIHSLSIVQLYRSYPVNLKQMIKSNHSLEFPAVTICNMNPVKKDLIRCSNERSLYTVENKLSKGTNATLHTSTTTIEARNYIVRNARYSATVESLVAEKDRCLQQMKQLKKEHKKNEYYLKSLTDVYSDGQKSFDDEIELLRKANPSTTPSHGCASATTINPYSWSPWSSANSYAYSNIFNCINSSNPNNKKLNEVFDVSEYIGYGHLTDLNDIRRLVKLSKNTVDVTGHPISEMIVECSYDRQKCSGKSFSTWVDPKFGQCHTFNSGFHRKKVIAKEPLRTTYYGNQYGLRLTVNINHTQYLGMMSSDYGIQLVVHQSRKPILPEIDGISVQPGKLTTLGLKWSQVDREPSPYPSHCAMEYPASLWNIIARSIPYSNNYCRSMCLKLAVMDRCNCTDIRIIEMGMNETAINQKTPCQITERKDRVCQHDVYGGQLQADNCNCAPSCKEINFKKYLSEAKWPTMQYQRLKVNNFLGKDKISKLYFNSMQATVDNAGDTLISRNLVRLHIHYQVLNMEISTEIPAYPLISVLANLGGIMGMYLGLSIVALVEIAQFPLLLFLGKSSTICVANDDDTVSVDHSKVNPNEDKESIPMDSGLESDLYRKPSSDRSLKPPHVVDAQNII